jgi:hypothetical protein
MTNRPLWKVLASVFLHIIAGKLRTIVEAAKTRRGSLQHGASGGKFKVLR